MMTLLGHSIFARHDGSFIGLYANAICMVLMKSRPTLQHSCEVSTLRLQYLRFGPFNNVGLGLDRF
jgi:hypothetical protein